MLEYRVVQKRQGWVVQMRKRGAWFWRTHWPFGCRQARFYPDEISARWGANVCRRADARKGIDGVVNRV